MALHVTEVVTTKNIWTVLRIEFSLVNVLYILVYCDTGILKIEEKQFRNIVYLDLWGNMIKIKQSKYY